MYIYRLERLQSVKIYYNKKKHTYICTVVLGWRVAEMRKRDGKKSSVVDFVYFLTELIEVIINYLVIRRRRCRRRI